jgi:serine phosphatase RsbU (regulator of sigma subunit)
LEPNSVAISDVEAGASSSVAEQALPEVIALVNPPRRHMLHLGTVIVLVVGLVITGVLTFGAASVHQSNEDHLLQQRARDVAAVVSASAPNILRPLASAAALVEATSARPLTFKQLMAPIVGNQRQFVSASVWLTHAKNPRPVVTAGAVPELTKQPPAKIRSYLQEAGGEASLYIYDLLNEGDRRLGYAVSAHTRKEKYVVYAEVSLPKDRRAAIDQSPAFADLGYALYLGTTENSRQLVASSTGGELLHGRRASEIIPFGHEKLLVVVTPHRELGGTLLARLPWALGAFGLLITLAAAALVEGLTRRRAQAEMLAYENAQLYADQRSVAQTLQHSLLPDAFPSLPGVDFAARYIAGVEGIDIGGDWYDVVQLDDGRLVVVVGDVSGRGLHAATMMASLRYAIRAYAVQGDAPSDLLTKLSRLASVGRDGHFATVLCGNIDVVERRVTFANAGHPRPLVITGKNAEFVSSPVGVPVGVVRGAQYLEVTASLPPGATLLMYTDGLIERRGESIDTGLERLRAAAQGHNGSLDELLTEIVRQAIPQGSDDDTAILGLRWRS